MLIDFPEHRQTEKIIGCAIHVHRRLGPGLLEKTYEECLAYELRKAGFSVGQQRLLPITYDSLQLTDGYRIDLIVNDSIILELKNVEKLTSLHAAQVLTYLRLSGKRVGLLFNFNTEVLKHGIQRIVNSLQYGCNTSVSSDPLCPPSNLSL